MPELPEVETIVRELGPALAGRGIAEVRVFRANALGDCPPARFAAGLVGRAFAEVGRRGKFLVFRLEPEAYLIGHLRMTGKFLIMPEPPAPGPHDRVWFRLAGGSLLVFQDMRCFGTLVLAEHPEEHAGLARLGMDPLGPGFTARWLAAALAASRAPLKHWLMDQSKVCGLGNIYAAEILFRAGLSPLRPAAAVSAVEARGLHRAIRQVLRQAIAKNGTTISDYRRVDEKTGQFQNWLRVYGKAEAPCPRCRTPIARIRQQQRSTFYCPGCQA